MRLIAIVLCLACTSLGQEISNGGAQISGTGAQLNSVGAPPPPVGSVATDFFGAHSWVNGAVDIGKAPYPQFGVGCVPVSIGKLIPATCEPAHWIRSWDTYSGWPYSAFNTTGTIAVTNASKAVVGSGTNFASSMTGMTIMVGANSNEYTVASVTDSTHLTLTATYTSATASGQGYSIYNFSQIDKMMDYALTNGKFLLYTFQGIPSFLSTNPTDTNCHRASSAGSGSCDAPKDLYGIGGTNVSPVNSACSGNLQGTNKTACSVRVFVTDIFRHFKNRGTPIKFMELGNEDDFSSEWTAAPSTFNWTNDKYHQFADFMKVAHDTAVIQNPTLDVTTTGWGINCATSPNNQGFTFLQSWLAAGAKNLSNVKYFGYHNYMARCASSPNQPTVTQSMLDSYKSMIQTACVGGTAPACSTIKFWDTEDSWSSVPLGGGYTLVSITRSGSTVTGTCSQVCNGGGSGFSLGQIYLWGVNNAAFPDGYKVVTGGNGSTTFTYTESGTATTVTGAGRAVNEYAQAGFVLQRLVTEYHYPGVSYAGWYDYADTANPGSGVLLDRASGTNCLTGIPCHLRYAGQVVGLLYKWEGLAATRSRCVQTGAIWTCDATYANGPFTKSRIVWDTSCYTFVEGECTPTNNDPYTVPLGFTQMQDFHGDVTAITAGWPVGLRWTPIFLQGN